MSRRPSANSYQANVEYYPGESRITVVPQNGAVVCCGIYGVFEHTGIWVDDHIVELHGSGLVKAVSPQRFLSDRSGNTIYILCNAQLQPLAAPGCEQRAISRIFTYVEYHPWGNNCHRFSMHCVNGKHDDISSFNDLNRALSHHFGGRLHWQPLR